LLGVLEVVHWFCGWSMGGTDNHGFATSEMNKERMIAWLQETIGHVKNTEPVRADG
jgi:hypothetical protein